MREENSVGLLVQILTDVLTQYSSFGTKTVKQTLRVCSQLIDWNELALFERLVPYIFEFLRFP